jgi:hypothetical protein
VTVCTWCSSKAAKSCCGDNFCNFYMGTTYRRSLNPVTGSGKKVSRDLMLTHRPQGADLRIPGIDDNFLESHPAELTC